MGRQINFVMSQADEQEFWEMVCNTGNVEMLPFSADEAGPSAFVSPELVLSNNNPVIIYLWNSSITPSNRIVRKYVDATRSYALDATQSEVIEFARTSGANDGKRPGRLWIETHGNDQEFSSTAKADEFIDWYESLRKWIQKNYQRVNANYIGRHVGR